VLPRGDENDKEESWQCSQKKAEEAERRQKCLEGERRPIRSANKNTRQSLFQFFSWKRSEHTHPLLAEEEARVWPVDAHRVALREGAGQCIEQSSQPSAARVECEHIRIVRSFKPYCTPCRRVRHGHARNLRAQAWCKASSPRGVRRPSQRWAAGGGAPGHGHRNPVAPSTMLSHGPPFATAIGGSPLYIASTLGMGGK